MVDKRVYILAAAIIILSLSPVAASFAEEVPDDGGERCIDTRRISSTDVVDAHNILFYMRGGVIYRNTLPHKCTALARENRFSYRTTISRLCDIDMITVLYDFGSGLSQGPSCGLGRFYPISKDEAQALKNPDDIDLEPEPLPPADPEEPKVSE